MTLDPLPIALGAMLERPPSSTSSWPTDNSTHRNGERRGRALASQIQPASA
jgi:hypothetical protein